MHAEEARIRRRFGVRAGPPKSGALFNREILAASVALGVLISTGCGGAYQSVKPPNKAPYQESLAQIQVIATAVPSIQIGNTVLLYASAGYQDSPNSITYKDVTNSATWSTSDPAIASVSNGVVTGTGSGPVTITASFGGKSGSTIVIVGLTSTIAISPPGPLVKSARPDISFLATATYSDGTVLDLTNFAFWTSSPPGILTFDYYYPGYATIVAAGSTTVTATFTTGEISTLTITVIP